ncbi:MAG: AAA family ATPase, partial [Clostridia bacterium]|nr:AAA family ATPase [Clostridia bacterium]
MLELLHIENIAVVARAEITFSAGLNVLTGETGAGKSIIIDAIGAILGERTSRDIIRTGEKQAFVSAVFSACGAEIDAVLESLGLPATDGGTLTVARRVYADGRNLCHVNAMPAPLAALRELGQLLCKSLGQHDSRLLMDTAEHLKLLDRYAKTEALLETYTVELRRLKEIRAEQKSLLTDADSIERKREILAHTVNELEAANITPGEDDILIARRAAAQSAEKTASAIAGAVRSLSGFDGSIAESAESAARALMPLCGQGNAAIDAVYTSLNDAAAMLRDSADTLELELEACNFSEQEMDEIETRLSFLNEMKRKYGGSLDAVCTALVTAKDELERLSETEARAAELAAAYAAQYTKTMRLATELSQKRKEAAEVFSAKICDELAYLKMAGSRFSVHLTQKERDGRVILGADGIDNAEFYMSANRGEQERPLAKTASGGELSRIMLALHTVQTADNAPTYVFDEIDAGISGIAASRVAKRL